MSEPFAPRITSPLHRSQVHSAREVSTRSRSPSPSACVSMEKPRATLLSLSLSRPCEFQLQPLARKGRQSEKPYFQPARETPLIARGQSAQRKCIREISVVTPHPRRVVIFMSRIICAAFIVYSSTYTMPRGSRPSMSRCHCVPFRFTRSWCPSSDSWRGV